MLPNVTLNKKQRCLLFLGLNLTWGIVLWWSIFPYGMGTSRDSVEYLYTSLSLVHGNGFTSFGGDVFNLWPPLYPILLSILQWMTRWNPYQAAEAIQTLSLLPLAFLIAKLFVDAFPDDFWLAFLGNLMAMAGGVMTMLYEGLATDHFHMFLAVGMVLLAGSYIHRPRITAIWLLVLVSALAMLQRYLGGAVALTAGLIIFLFPLKSTLWERVKRSAWMILSVIPVGLWIFTISTSTLQRELPRSLAENLNDFTLSALRWFLTYDDLLGHPVRVQIWSWGFWLVTVGAIIIILISNRRTAVLNADTLPALLYGLTYSILLVGVALVSFFNKLDDRFLAPVYLPFIVLIVLTTKVVYDFFYVRGVKVVTHIAQVMLVAMLILALGLTMRQSFQRIVLSRTEGGGYTDHLWRSNNTLQYWQNNPRQGQYLVFSNYPAGVAFYTWHEVLSSPRRTPNPDLDTVYPLESYVDTLFRDGLVTYLVWIEPNAYTHVYSVDDLRQVADIKVLYEGEDGGVYQLLPKK